MTEFIVDIARYQNAMTLDHWKILKDHGLVGVIVKGCQAEYEPDHYLDDHINNLNALGIPYAIYHWPDPLRPLAPQIEKILNVHRTYGGASITGDAEQWWADWVKWAAYNAGDRTIKVPIIPADTLYAFYRDYFNMLITESPVNVAAYSAPWFINGYAPKLAGYITSGQMPYFNAYYFYVQDYDNDKRVDWNEFEDHCQRIQQYMNASYLPNGINSYDLWQIGVMNFNGMPCSIDVDLPTDRTMEIFFGENPQNPPPQSDTSLNYVAVNEPFTNLRDYPWGNDIGDIYPGTPLEVVDIGGNDAWLKLADGTWICAQTIINGRLKVFVRKV